MAVSSNYGFEVAGFAVAITSDSLIEPARESPVGAGILLELPCMGCSVHKRLQTCELLLRQWK